MYNYFYPNSYKKIKTKKLLPLRLFISFVQVLRAWLCNFSCKQLILIATKAAMPTDFRKNFL